MAFDEMLSEVADVLPSDLAREVFRYDFRMKYLHDWISQPSTYGGKLPGSGDIREMPRTRDALVGRIEALSRRTMFKLALARRE